MTGPLDSSSSITAGVVVLTDAATITMDASTGNHFRVTLGGNRTMGTPASPYDGQKITLEIIQDATGGRTLTLPLSAFSFCSEIPSLVLSTAPGLTDVAGFAYSANLGNWLMTGILHGFS